MFLGTIKINNPLFLKLLKDDSIIDFLTSGISTSNTQILKIKQVDLKGVSKKKYRTPQIVVLETEKLINMFSCPF